MRDFSKISPKFWTGHTGTEIRALGLEAQVVALYLMTNPHANMIGLYYLPLPYMACDMGLSVEQVTATLASLHQIGFCEYSTKTQHVWVHEMLHYQLGHSLKLHDNRVQAVNQCYEDLPSRVPFLGRFYERYGAHFHLKARSPHPAVCPDTLSSDPMDGGSKEGRIDELSERHHPPSEGGTHPSERVLHDVDPPFKGGRHEKKEVNSSENTVHEAVFSSKISADASLSENCEQSDRSDLHRAESHATRHSVDLDHYPPCCAEYDLPP